MKGTATNNKLACKNFKGRLCFERRVSIIKDIVEKRGYKYATQRKIILEELLDAEGHLKAEEIYNKVKDRNIGIATVYRTLETFTDLGIIKEINIDGVSYYEQKIYSKKPLHIHFKCIKCNSIIDIDDKDLAIEYLNLNKKIEENNKIQIFDSDILLSGICEKCLEGIKCQDQ